MLIIGKNRAGGTGWQRRRRHHSVAFVGTTVAALALLVFPTTAATGAAAPPVDQVILDLDAHPVLNWSVPDRWDASWQAWNSTTGYDQNVINPTSWAITLDGCASTSKYAVTGYTFTIAQIGTAWTQTQTTPTCKLVLQSLPARGSYRASLTMRTRGAVDGVSSPVTRTTAVKDYLIVSMGDSLASGEGNPDVPGSYSYSVDIDYDDWPEISVQTNKAATWKDERCHRSAKSGPSLAAKAFEDASPYTSVTFVSVACSGAEVRHLISDSYAGQVPVGSTTEPPQIQAVAQLVGPRAANGPRPIDALLVSAGINNLGFASIINRCATNNNFSSSHTGCVYADNLQTKIDDLTRQYAYLALSLAVGLPNTREVYLSNYPAQVFRGGGCGALGGSPGGVHVPGLGIDTDEVAKMNTAGSALNSSIATAASTFRSDPYQWNRIPDLTAPFRLHAYCDSDSWFNTLEHSAKTQGDINGTAHPNAAGHARYASILRSTITLN